MVLNAATRAALRKRKQSEAPRSVISDDTENMRKACRSKFEDLTHDSGLASEMEEELFSTCHGITQKYRTAFRRLYICLRNPETRSLDRLIKSDMSPIELVHLAVEGKIDALKTDSQQKADKEMKEISLKQSVGKKLVPGSLEKLLDGREASKWGMGKSQAAKD